MPSLDGAHKNPLFLSRSALFSLSFFSLSCAVCLPLCLSHFALQSAFSSPSSSVRDRDNNAHTDERQTFSHASSTTLTESRWARRDRQMNHQSTRISSVRMSTLITLKRVCGFSLSFRSSLEVSADLFRSTDEDDAHRRIPDGDNQIVIRSERPTEGGGRGEKRSLFSSSCRWYSAKFFVFLNIFGIAENCFIVVYIISPSSSSVVSEILYPSLSLSSQRYVLSHLWFSLSLSLSWLGHSCSFPF